MPDQPTDALVDRARQDDRAEIARLTAAEARAKDAVRSGLDRLDSVVRADDDAAARGATPAIAALMATLRAYGLAGAAAADRMARANTLGDAAQTLGVRLRRIVLPHDWRDADHGHLLGVLAPEGRDEDDAGAGHEVDAYAVDGAAVVALIRTGKGYRYVHPATGAAAMVDDTLADRLIDIAFAPYPPLPESAKDAMGLARFMLPIMRQELTTVIALGAVTGLLGAVFPLATALVIDSLIPGGARGLLVQVGLALGLGAVVTFLLGLAQKRALLRLDGKTDLLMEAAVWDRLLKLPATFFSAYPSGDLRKRVGGIAALRNAITEVALSATITATFSLFYLGLMFTFDTRLALLGALLIVLLAIATVVTGLIQIRQHRKQVVVEAWLSGFVFQALQGIVKLRVAAAEDRAFVRWADRYAEERTAIRRARRIGEHFAAFAGFYGVVATAALYAAAFHLADERLPAGLFIAFLAAYGSFQGAFMSLSTAGLKVAAALPEWERGKPVLEAEPETPAQAADPGDLTGAIEMTNISFAYNDGPPVLQDVSIDVRPGEQVALVGPSGSGKSTLLRVMLGLERPQSGSVLYDGQDLSGLDPTLVRRQIGVVTQTGRIFAGTLMENIRGAGVADYDACIAACEAAGFAEDLATLPMGLHTPMTEGAPTLSGGQRQRLLIARALVNRPRLLVFDEATSALDNRTQAIVTESIGRLNITRVVVAHRLSTIRDADRIYVLDRGRLVETGKYDDLMEKDGLFAALARRQIA